MTSKAKNISNANGKQFLQDSFSQEQKILKLQLEMSSASITHNGLLGEVNEKHFIKFIRRYLPNRYAVDSGIVIDSRGRTSDQIDIIIFDNQYTPTLLDQQSHRYIPAESVYGIFEVKPYIDKENLEYTGRKAESVRILERTSIPIPYADGVYPAKPHANIIAGIIAIRINWTDDFGCAFSKVHETLVGSKYVDCGLALTGASFDTFSESNVFSF